MNTEVDNVIEEATEVIPMEEPELPQPQIQPIPVSIPIEKKICKKCNSEIKVTNRKTFCSDKCAKAFHSLKRYHAIKTTDDYKNKRREYKIKIKRDKIILSTEQREV